MWLLAAILSAVFAGLTSVLAKCGIRKTSSDVATAIRTIVVLLGAWLMVLVVGSASTAASISPRSLVFLLLSGLATGASWICYFRALALGDVNHVVPVDKSSTALTVLLAILCFGETAGLVAKLIGTALLTIGIYLMIDRKPIDGTPRSRAWLPYAILSAIFASLTSIFAKIGITDVESNLATAIRTGVVLLIAWGIVFVKGEHRSLGGIERRELVFILLSGVATCASWLCYYYAIQNGVLSIVVPIDKMSVLVTVLCARFLFGEKLSPRAWLGLLVMTGGTLCMALSQ